VQIRYIVFKTTLVDMHNITLRGFAATMDDSTLFMSREKFALTFEKVDLDAFQKHNYNEIKQVRLQRKGSVGRGILLGSLGGFLVGALVGAAQPVQQSFLSEVNTEGNVIGGAFTGAAVGCLVGAAIGALSHKVFTINGKRENLVKMQEAMIDRLYR
jgi:hypothetical protein